MRVFTLVALVVLLMKSPVLALENMGPQAREFIREVSSMSTLNYFGLSVGCDGISTSRVESLMKRRLSLRRIRAVPTNFTNLKGKLFVHTTVSCWQYHRKINIQGVKSVLRFFLSDNLNDAFDIGINRGETYVNFSGSELEEQIEKQTDILIADFIDAHLEAQ